MLNFLSIFATSHTGRSFAEAVAIACNHHRSENLPGERHHQKLATNKSMPNLIETDSDMKQAGQKNHLNLIKNQAGVHKL